MGNYPKPLKETRDIRMSNGEFPYLDIEPVINIFAPDYSDVYIEDVGNPALLTYTRASKASFFSNEGKLVYFPNNKIRLDYNPLNRGKRGFLVENQATNLIPSNTFRLALGSEGSGTLTKDTDSVFNVPRGSNLLTKGVEGRYGVEAGNATGSLTASKEYTCSCVAKLESDTFEWMGFEIGNYAIHLEGNSSKMLINTKTHEIIYNDPTAKDKFYIEFWDDGYIYIARSFTTIADLTDAASQFAYARVYVQSKSTGNAILTGDGKTKIYLLMPQIEAATTGFSTPRGSSYVALSESATTTRSADVLKLSISELSNVTSVTGTLLLDIDGVRTCTDGTFKNGYQLTKKGRYRQIALFPRKLTDDEKFKVING